MIVIPMAGLSSRFTAAGYDRPKYMLPLSDGTIFDKAVGSFSAYFETVPFLFVARDVMGTRDFIRASCDALGLKRITIAMLDEPTAGQAETVALGLRQAGVGPDAPLTIFNIDTFRPGFRFPDTAWFPTSDGYLEVFRGSGANWSYVRPSGGSSGIVLETAEKRPISDLCCTGLYHFAHTHDFLVAYYNEANNPTAPELYVAPLYNYLVQKGQHVHYIVIDPADIQFCGVPAEYEALRAQS